MRRSWLPILAVVAASLGYSSIVVAQPPGFGGSNGSSGFSRRGFSDEDKQRLFANYDRNRDGKITYDEASDRTKPFFKAADTNGDGALDFNEYNGYLTQRMSSFGIGGSSGGPPSSSGSSSSSSSASGIPSSGPPSFGGSPGFGGPPGFGSPPSFDYSRFSDRGRDDRDRDRDRNRDGGSRDQEKAEIRAVAIRFGKLPENLPDWFKGLDTDKDGQVALYEWRKGGRSQEEFAAIDLNADSLLTAEEWFRSERLAADKKKLDDLIAAAEGTPVSTSAASESEKNRDKSSSKSSKPSKPARPDNPFARK